MKFLLLGLTALLLGVVAGDPLKVTVFYAALCPYSRKFFLNQLSPSYETLDGDSTLDLHLVPRAHFASAGSAELTCIHGDEECLAEEFQSCVLSGDYTQKQKLTYLVCEFNEDDPGAVASGEKCAKESGIDWDTINECYNNGEGHTDLIDFIHQVEDAGLTVPHVPYVMYNQDLNATVDGSARANFLKVTCGLLENAPSGCSSS